MRITSYSEECFFMYFYFSGKKFTLIFFDSRLGENRWRQQQSQWNAYFRGQKSHFFSVFKMRAGLCFTFVGETKSFVLSKGVTSQHQDLWGVLVTGLKRNCALKATAAHCSHVKKEKSSTSSSLLTTFHRLTWEKEKCHEKFFSASNTTEEHGIISWQLT